MDPDKHSSPDEGSFSEAVRDLADEKRRELGEHPTAEVLVAFSEKRLAAAEEEAVRDHLVLCPECRDLLRDLGGFGAEPPEESPELGDVDMEAAWQGLRSRLGGEGGEGRADARVPVVRAKPERRSTKGRWFTDRNHLAMAASLLLAVAGFAWGGYSWRLMRDETKPKVNVPLVNLFPEEDRTRGSEDLAKVPAQVEDFMLVITPPELRSPIAYLVEVAQGDRVLYTAVLADPVFEREDPRRATGAGGSLTLLLRRRDFPAGSYEARLFAVQDGRRGQKVADYRFVVEGS